MNSTVCEMQNSLFGSENLQVVQALKTLKTTDIRLERYDSSSLQPLDTIARASKGFGVLHLHQ